MKLSRQQGNRIASALLIVVLIAIIAWTFHDSPARKVDHSTAEVSDINSREQQAFEADKRPLIPLEANTVPRGLRPLWQVQSRSNGISPSPIVFDDVTIAVEARGVRALDTSTGNERWHYRRDALLCTASKSNGRLILTFGTESGCGETVSLEPKTGTYAATRRSLAPAKVSAIRSNSYAGVFSAQFVELWRDDLVRVVEYGDIPVPSESNLQPHANCTIINALTRLDLLAVLNDCNGQARLVLQAAVPEESRKPQIYSDVELGAVSDDLQLVAIGKDAATIRRGDAVTSYRKDGTRLGSTNIAEAGKYPPAEAAPNSEQQDTDLSFKRPTTPGARDSRLELPEDAVITADLPHHMTWLSPHGLVGLNPNNLDFAFLLPDAVGTGDGWNDFLLYPTTDGVSVVNLKEPEKALPLSLMQDAQQSFNGLTSTNESGRVSLKLSGSILMAQRGEQLSAYEVVF